MPLLLIDFSSRLNCLCSSSLRRQTYLRPSVSPGAEAEVGIISTFRRSVSLTATAVSPEEKGPTTASTLSSCMSLRAPIDACFGSEPVSKRKSSIFLPAMPPATLICSTARSIAATLGSPGPFSGPAVTTILPILMVFWARAAPPSDVSAAASNMVLSFIHDLLARMFVRLHFFCSTRHVGGVGRRAAVAGAQISCRQRLVACERLGGVLEHDLA